MHGERGGPPGASTQDYLDAVSQVRPTVSEPALVAFAEDIAAFART